MLNKNFVNKQRHKAYKESIHAYENDDGSVESYNNIFKAELRYNYWWLVGMSKSLLTKYQTIWVFENTRNIMKQYLKECKENDDLFSL